MHTIFYVVGGFIIASVIYWPVILLLQYALHQRRHAVPKSKTEQSHYAHHR